MHMSKELSSLPARHSQKFPLHTSGSAATRAASSGSRRCGETRGSAPTTAAASWCQLLPAAVQAGRMAERAWHATCGGGSSSVGLRREPGQAN